VGKVDEGAVRSIKKDAKDFPELCGSRGVVGNAPVVLGVDGWALGGGGEEMKWREGEGERAGMPCLNPPLFFWGIQPFGANSSENEEIGKGSQFLPNVGAESSLHRGYNAHENPFRFWGKILEGSE